MPLQAVEPLRLYRQIAGQIATLIEQGEYRAGAKLPAERELAGLLGVSRTSVREAIISLELSGLVEVRVGTGIFVRDAATRASAPLVTADADAGPGPFELLAARSVIEGETAALAARGRSPQDLEALKASIERMRTHDDDFAERDAADREFHERIATATGNGALAWVIGTLWDQRRSELWRRTERHFHTPALRARTLLDHQAIVGAIERQDADAAREAMRGHLSRVAREFERSIELGESGKRARSGRAQRAKPAATGRRTARKV
ncbi:MAG: FadR/GntR family transcriptional regulator [Casimicrobiaceae bacterium]